MTAEATTAPSSLRILRLRDVMSTTGLKRSMIYRLQAEGRFPKSVKITDYAVGWIDAEINAWVAGRAAQRRGAQSP